MQESLYRIHAINQIANEVQMTAIRGNFLEFQAFYKEFPNRMNGPKYQQNSNVANICRNMAHETQSISVYIGEKNFVSDGETVAVMLSNILGADCMLQQSLLDMIH